MKTVCLIPARGGSKRIPKKNIKELQGTPLVAHSINKAKKAELIDVVWVSTEDEEIAKISKKYGAMVIERPKELATDTARARDVMIHFAKNVDFDNILLFECTYPLTTIDDLNQLIIKYFKNMWDSALSLKKTMDYIWKINKDGTAEPVSYKLGHNLRTQDYEGLYIESGGLYITSRKALLKSECCVSGKIGYYVLPHPSFEIDTLDDFKIVESLL